MLGNLLPLLFFFFWVVVTDVAVGLQLILDVAISVTWVWGVCESSWQHNSSWLKYSISFIMRDPTVPLVPISTGVCAGAAMFSGTSVAKLLDLYMFCFFLVKEDCRWRVGSFWVWCWWGSCFESGSLVHWPYYTQCFHMNSLPRVLYPELVGGLDSDMYSHCIHVPAVKNI